MKQKKPEKVYKHIKVVGYTHVVCTTVSRENSGHQAANYKGTGMALCAALHPVINVDQWIKNRREKDESLHRK